MTDLAVVDLETGEIVERKDGALAHFDPSMALVNDAKHDALIEMFKRLENWEAVDREIDKKLDDQEDTVNWWTSTVRKGRPKTISDTEILSADEAERLTGCTPVQITRWAKRLKDRMSYRAAIVGPAFKKFMASQHHHRVNYTGENEWYTPSEYIEAAREVMGAIDLDPASSEKAQAVVKATEFFTVQRDGLAQPWHGRVWMNPPYSQPLIANFIEKLILEAAEGRVEQAIVLTHNSTDTLWFHRLEEVAALLCFTRGRIAFIDPQGDRCAPTQGQAFFYLGERKAEFTATFARYGFIR